MKGVAVFLVLLSGIVILLVQVRNTEPSSPSDRAVAPHVPAPATQVHTSLNAYEAMAVPKVPETNSVDVVPEIAPSLATTNPPIDIIKMRDRVNRQDWKIQVGGKWYTFDELQRQLRKSKGPDKALIYSNFLGEIPEHQ